MIDIFNSKSYTINFKFENILEPLKNQKSLECISKLSKSYDYDPQDSKDVYVSLNELNTFNRKKKENDLLQKSNLTDGSCIGVTVDLVQLYEHIRGYCPFTVFSKYTLEASHLLVQLHEGNLKVLLLSPKYAAIILGEIGNIETSEYYLWLCDLSGKVTVSNDPETRNGSDIIEIIPKSDQLIFDALVFNGSLPQILGHKTLKNIYQEK